MSQYKKIMDNIEASDEFKQETLQRLEHTTIESRYIMKHTKKLIFGIAASLILSVGLYSTTLKDTPLMTPEISFDLTERIIVDPNAPSTCAAVNIEGTIVEVSEDGLSFKLNNGKWIQVTDETEIGITGPNAAEDQYFEPTFRVGNSIAAWSENTDSSTIIAYVVYSNWSWDDPIR